MSQGRMDQLERVVAGSHGFRTVLVEVQAVWEGVVHVLELEGHPLATRCDTLSSPVEGSERRKSYAVLQAPPVVSAADVVRVAIVQDDRRGSPSPRS